MPTPQEFTLMVHANTVLFVGLVIKLFLALVVGLAFLFGFVIVALYGSGKLLIYAYCLLLYVLDKASQVRQHNRKETEVIL